MKRKQIEKAIDSGKLLRLKDEPMSRVCRDLFGNIVVISLYAEEPVRLMTDDDAVKVEMITE